MNDRIVNLLVKQRYWLAGLSLVVLAFLMIGAKNLYMETSYRLFFAADNPQLMAHDHIENTYTKSDSVMFVFELADKEVFSRQTLALIKDFTDEAWKIPYSSRVDSITNYQYTWGVDDDLIVEDLVEDPAGLDVDQLADKRKRALAEPQLVNNLVSAQGHTTGVMVTLVMPDDQRVADRATLEVVNYARELARKFEERDPNLVKIHLTGETIVNATFAEMSEQDGQTLFPLMLLVIVLFLSIMLKSLTGMLGTLVIIIASVGASLGFTGWVGYAMNQVNVVAPIIILTLAVCDCVHILNTYYHQLAFGKEKTAAMAESLRVNLQPVVLTSVTTAVGFLSMNTSDSPPFWSLGNVSAFGVMLAMVLSLTLFPALIMFLPARKKVAHDGSGHSFAGLGYWVIRHQNPLLYGLLLVGIVLLSLIPRNELNDDTVAYFHEDVPFRQAADFTQANLTGFDTISYSLDSKESNGVSDPAYLAKIESFTDWLMAQPEVVHVSTFTDVLKRLNKNMHGDNPDWYRLPDDRELAAQFLLLYEISLPFGLDLNNQINLDKSSLLIKVRIKDQKAYELIALDERAQQWLRQYAPDLLTNGASVSLMFAHIGKRNIDSMISGSLIALVLVTLTLMLALRSWKYGIVSLIPNAFPAGMTFGLWSLLDGEVNLAVAVIFAITLGIVVDDTVHFMTKFLRGKREQGMAGEQAVLYAFEQVGTALVTTSVVLACGFFVLALSSFDVNSSIGLLVGITILIALVWDLLFLPAILLKIDRWGLIQESVLKNS